MNWKIVTTILLMAYSQNAFAQKDDPIIQNTKYNNMFKHAITGHFGVGTVSGFFASSLGLEYEQFFTNRHFFSVTLEGVGYLGGHIGFGPLKEGDVWSQTYGYYLAPGLRFHPIGNKYFLDPGLGISFPFGVATRRDHVGQKPMPGVVDATIQQFLGAVLAEMTLNMQAVSRRVTISIFITGGPIYARPETRTYDFMNQKHFVVNNDPWVLQFGVRFGGRW